MAKQRTEKNEKIFQVLKKVGRWCGYEDFKAGWMRLFLDEGMPTPKDVYNVKASLKKKEDRKKLEKLKKSKVPPPSGGMTLPRIENTKNVQEIVKEAVAPKGGETVGEAIARVQRLVADITNTRLVDGERDAAIEKFKKLAVAHGMSQGEMDEHPTWTMTGEALIKKILSPEPVAPVGSTTTLNRDDWQTLDTAIIEAARPSLRSWKEATNPCREELKLDDRMPYLASPAGFAYAVKVLVTHYGRQAVIDMMNVFSDPE